MCKVTLHVPAWKCLILCVSTVRINYGRRDVSAGVPLNLSTPTGMSCIGTCGENYKSDNVSKYGVLLVAFNYYDTKN